MKHTPFLIFAVALFFCAGTTWAQDQAAPNQAAQTVTRAGSQPLQTGPAENFTGKVTVERLFSPNEAAPVGGASVSFEAGARSNWHTHPAGQRLIVTQGVGRTGEWNGPVREIKTGDVVWCPPGVKHWHGASPSSAMTHLALSGQVGGQSVTWLEPVSDAQYNSQIQTQATTLQNAKPTAAQCLMGDVAPKLADLTDNVLFGDVWERPQLSKRDRSLATVSALIALNRPDQLRSHLQRARDNGLTQEELIQTITHLAFYAGWPNAVSAVGVARDVFAAK